MVDVEIAGALNREVIGVGGVGKIALCHDAGDRGGAHACAELDAHRQHGAGIGSLRSGLLDILVEQVLEFGALLLR